MHHCLGVLSYIIANAATKCSITLAYCNRSALYAPQLLWISRELYCDMDGFSLTGCACRVLVSSGSIPLAPLRFLLVYPSPPHYFP